MENAKKVLPNIRYANDAQSALKDKDALILVTEWPQFSQMDLTLVKKLLRKPVIVDGRNAIDPARARELGFTYIGIGR